MGRPSQYNSYVKPHLDRVKAMAQTHTEEQIARALGVSPRAFFDYKKKHPELRKAIIEGRQDLCSDLRSTLIRRAKGFTYEERNTHKEGGVVIYEDVKTKTALPDVAALNLCLKNYDETWRNDPAEYELKKKALELQERKVEFEEW